MRFKELYNEAKHWEQVDIKRCNKRWSIKLPESGKRFYIKIDTNDIYDSMGSFLRNINARSNEGVGKDDGFVDHFEFAKNIIQGKINKVLVKPDMIEKLKGTWVL